MSNLNLADIQIYSITLESLNLALIAIFLDFNLITAIDLILFYSQRVSDLGSMNCSATWAFTFIFTLDTGIVLVASRHI